jgi:hypothetical protein
MLDSKRSEDGGNRGGGSYEQAPPAANEPKSSNVAPPTENYADDLPF